MRTSPSKSLGTVLVRDVLSLSHLVKDCPALMSESMDFLFLHTADLDHGSLFLGLSSTDEELARIYETTLERWYSLKGLEPMPPSHHKAVSAADYQQVLVKADSACLSFGRGFALILTSPPYFHPCKDSKVHGRGVIGSIADYVGPVSDLLVRAAEATRDRRVCFVKTDVWFRGMLIPVGFELARACMGKGLRLRDHSIYRRLNSFSPYGPTFSNVFLFCDTPLRLRSPQLLDVAPRRRQGLPSSFTPEVFTKLILCLTAPGDVVLDPFAGLGSVLRAARDTGRRSIGVECCESQVSRARRVLFDAPEFECIDSVTSVSGGEHD